MKPNQLLTSVLGITALFVTSCSTSRMAGNDAIQDDVYSSVVQAREYKEVPVAQNVTAQNDVAAQDDYGLSDPYFDMDYQTRINRFYYANPWRTYYDGFYGFSPHFFGARYGYYSNAYNYNFYGVPFDTYGFNMGFGWLSPFHYDPFRFGFGGLYGNWYHPFSAWGYGAPFYGNYWGPISYYAGGGYYGGVRNNIPNYTPRPRRGSENGVTRGTGYFDGNNNGTVSAGRSRAEQYNPGNNSTTRANSSGNTASRPNTTNDSRPTRSSSDSSPRQNYTPPPRQSSPPPTTSSSSGSGSRAESGSSGGRPTRGGGR